MKPINRLPPKKDYNVIQKYKVPSKVKILSKSRIQKQKLHELLVGIGKTNEKARNEIERFCKSNEIPVVYLNSNKIHEIKRMLQQGASDYSTKYTLLVGDNISIPPLQVSEDTFSDMIYEDLDGDLYPDTPVGRVYGDINTIKFHILPIIADTNLALIFNAENASTKRHEKILKELGFDVYLMPTFDLYYKNVISKAEIIIQFSDGPVYGRVHGSPDEWLTHSKVILNANKLSDITFNTYPVIFSEACKTGHFGKLVSGFLKARALYIAAAGDTYNNLDPCDSWKNCLFADGFKIGLFDELDSHETIGDTKLAVEKELLSHFSNGLIKKFENLMNLENVLVDDQNFVSVVQWFLFGNPLRPPAIGPRGEFNGIRIPVDT